MGKEDDTSSKIKKNKKYNTFIPNAYLNHAYALPNISINREGVIVYVNDDTSRILGYTKKELLGMEATNIYLNPSDREFLLKELYEEGKIQNFNVKLKTKNGKLVECKLEKSVFRDSEGNILGHTGTIKDIQLESDLRQKLENENKKLFSVLEQMPVYICLYDSNRNIVFANKYLKNRFKKIESNKCYKIFYDYKEPCEICPVLKVFETNEPIVYEKTQKDGKIFELHTYPFLDNEGNKFVLELGIDITQRKKTEEQMIQINETLEILNKILRHDILNDLTVALNFCDLISTEDVDIKERVMKSISKSVELIENAREFEKTFNGNFWSKEVKLFDIKSKINDLTKHYPEIKINLLGNCRILVDESIIIVFDNIIRNARLHGKADEINISIKRDGKYCEVSFADNGIGIPEEAKNKLFEEGFSFGPNKGSGLGLYISKKIIEKHGGIITATDNKPKGTIINLRFKSEDPHEIC
ncbi:MAG: sensory histidine kinase AtoS [Candidatus Methanofastidiosum methylothiophilum]|uniref:histidine kinase n=1 Tax=Candidatus Methanofastidiosum methylothiophilum TaxID=1705564 RepID=A0A150IVY1_9EURY|nr:MAG: sensory histidine kinase AtoS [Candidatus Methanofastidiosum methylthiophilus]KYC46858.1 MAG: sensory histidine kinase AtoS [Candidatus Methanofastidiosum methylthiophilus]KYC49092.1 MAG: sensory histidine kinase AtoS [Candidatus Methanofastidiosum methylthiophilus]